MANIYKTETVLFPLLGQPLIDSFMEMITRRKLVIMLGIVIGIIVFAIQFNAV